MSRVRQCLLLPASLVLLFGYPTQAQESSVFVDRIDVNVVNVEVFVTDSNGQPVEGLSRDDFEVFEDGQRVEVANFYTVKRQSELGDEVDSTSPTAATGEATPSVTARRAVPPEQQLHLLVYIDNFSIRQANRQRVLESLESFLGQRVAKNDRVMVVTYNRGIQAIQPFTDDPQQLATALGKIQKLQSNGQRENFRRRTASRAISAALSEPDTAHQARDILQRYIQETRANLLQSVNAIQEAVRSLGGLPGRKAMLYVSDGLPQNPGQALTEQFFGRQRLNANESALFNRVIREANAQQVTFYALDARGPSGASAVSAEMTDNVAGGTNRGILDARRTMDSQEPLIGMSEPTGGASFLNTVNHDVSMAAMAEDFDHFYSLGYTSTRSGDGSYHTIEVRAKRSGLKVRHRSGFLDKPEAERVADRTVSALVLGSENNPMGIQIEIDEPEKKGKSYRVPILIRIPTDQLTLIPNGETHEARLRIFLVVQDSNGGISPVKSLPYPVSIPEQQLAEARRNAIGYVTQLEMRAGEQTLAVGVWDEHSGADSFSRKLLVIGKAKKRK